jgi:hypothetical protein
VGSPNELEYQIEVTDETLRLAASLIRASKPDVEIPWPSDLNDDCIRPTPGGLPAQLRFSPNRWATVRTTEVPLVGSNRSWNWMVFCL